MNKNEAKQIFRHADCITFDVDSTVCTDEAIDELALFVGKQNDVVEITKLAMDGFLTYNESLRRRLDIIQPSLETLRKFKKQKSVTFSKNVEELVKCLQLRQVPVFLITGGFQEIVHHIADKLGIPRENVYANKFNFTKEGLYDGFDNNRLTCRDNGKSEVIKEIKNKHNFTKLVHVGDGMNDALVCPPADAFIGYGGNQVRESVQRLASWYVMDFKELLDELNS